MNPDLLARVRAILERSDDLLHTCIDVDEFDHARFVRTEKEFHPLNRVVIDWMGQLPAEVPLGIGTSALAGMWKSRWKFTDEDHIHPDSLGLSRLLRAATEQADWNRLRAFTKHDEVNAAMAAVLIMRAMESAASEVGQARQALEDATQAIDDGPGDSDDLEHLEHVLEQALDRYEQAQRTDAGHVAKVVEAIEDQIEQLEDDERARRTWGIEPGGDHHVDPNIRVRTSEQLRSLSRYAAMVGRFVHLTRVTRPGRIEGGRDHLVDVTMGADLTRLTATELANLASDDDLLALDTLRRLASQELAVRAYESDDKAGGGPIICCIDTSDSMTWNSGQRDVWAKACAWGLWKIAHDHRRPFHWVDFSTAVHERPVNTVAQALEAVGTIQKGGTNYDLPLRLALELLAKRPKADIVFITDGECKAHQPTIDAVNEARRAHGLRVFGVMVLDNPESLLAFCDEVRGVWDLADADQMTDLYERMQRGDSEEV